MNRYTILEIAKRTDSSSCGIDDVEDRVKLQDTFANITADQWYTVTLEWSDRQKSNLQFLAMHALSIDDFNRLYLDVIVPGLVDNRVREVTRALSSETISAREELKKATTLLTEREAKIAELEDVLEKTRELYNDMGQYNEQLRKQLNNLVIRNELTNKVFTHMNGLMHALNKWNTLEDPE